MFQTYRALKPGGRFFASTFLDTATIAENELGKGSGFHLFTVRNLEDDMKRAG